MKSKKILYLGLDPTRFRHKGALVHIPIIKIIPRPFIEVQMAFEKLDSYTHIVLTSRKGAELYCAYAASCGRAVQNKIYISVGSATTEILKLKGIRVAYTAQFQTGEGIVQLLRELDLKQAHLFFPRSALSRDVIPTYCTQHQIQITTLDLYDTQPSGIQIPDLTPFDQIIFTSPSTVHAFFSRCITYPPRKICIPIGPVTEKTLNQYYI